MVCGEEVGRESIRHLARSLQEARLSYDRWDVGHAMAFCPLGCQPDVIWVGAVKEVLGPLLFSGKDGGLEGICGRAPSHTYS